MKLPRARGVFNVPVLCVLERSSVLSSTFFVDRSGISSKMKGEYRFVKAQGPNLLNSSVVGVQLRLVS